MGDSLKRVLIHHNQKQESIAVREALTEHLKRIGFIVTEDHPDIIIVIGGDGTMLSAIRQYKFLQKPFIGINTGTLGFLPAISPENLAKLADCLKERKYDLHSYPLIKARVKTNDEEIIEDYGFNEIVIKHLEPRLMEAKIYINGQPFNYFTGDGFIIATPIGATGYGIWAGGVATHSELPLYQLIPIHPNDNSVNRPLKTPMIIPLDTVIRFEIMKSLSREILIACDGVKMEKHSISEIEVSVADMPIRILRIGEFNYFDDFKKKIVDKGELRTIHENL
ncbi:NAD kinase [Thermotalea metallivorans]|uniref:NAD kinase n=1 Tax=Thermotalea metallivorans TaxID=520762 RepID=A0A140L1J1_9FIRM|nr:NAD kinase [Thermotalea metallivorans]